MKVKRINDNTISCTITPEDLRANGFKLDDFFERKKEAVEFIRQTVAQIAISENFNLEGELTTMRISVLPDHSLNLLITREDTSESAAREVRRIARSIFDSIASKAAEKAAGKEEEQDSDSAGSLMQSLLHEISENSEDGTEENKAEKTSKAEKTDKTEIAAKDSFMFSFYSVRDAMDCCKVFAGAGPLESSLYYLREDDTYFLIVRRINQTPAGFERYVLSANEFGELVTSEERYIAFVTEHGISIAKDHAIETFMNVIPGLKVPRIRKTRVKKTLQTEESNSNVQTAPGFADDPGEA